MSLLIQTNLSTVNPNKFYDGCCTTVTMELSVTDKDGLTFNEFFVFSTPNDFVSNITIDGNPVSTPFSLTTGVHQLSFLFCPTSIDRLTIQIKDSNANVLLFEFPISTVQMVTEILNYNSAGLDFGNVTVGNSAIQYLYLPDNIYQCAVYNFSNITAPFSIQPNATVCVGDGLQSIPITFTPTSTTIFDQVLDINGLDNCQSMSWGVVGRGIEAPPSGGGGNPVSGKRTVVDCPTSDCRLANGQPGFAQTTKNSINQISRVTRPKGGAGRGTNFR